MIINYLTEITKPYVEGIRKSECVEGLKKFLSDWKGLANDAIEAVESKEFSWEEYQDGVKLESKGKYSGDEWTRKYGAILLPEMLLQIGMTAEQFGVPDGTAYIRLKEAGIIK